METQPPTSDTLMPDSIEDLFAHLEELLERLNRYSSDFHTALKPDRSQPLSRSKADEPTMCLNHGPPPTPRHQLDEAPRWITRRQARRCLLHMHGIHANLGRLIHRVERDLDEPDTDADWN
jgi:hypothetical protein